MKKTVELVAVSFLALLIGNIGCVNRNHAAKFNQNKTVTELAPVKSLPHENGKGVYYSLFVRSFADSDGDGIGDFNGLTAKLDYLNDGNDATTTDLGITGIWLLPIFPSKSYHGYDVDDYYSVNPEYGTLEDFKRLAEECKKRGISLIIDMTCNHSSKHNPWFQASRNPEDPHRSWYHWITSRDEGYNRKQQIWGHELWNEDSEHPGNFYSGEFWEGMPDLNLDSPELRAEFKKIMDFWFENGVTGFRYDAAGHIYDACKKEPGFSKSTEYAVEWWKEIIDHNKSVKPDQYSVGEVWDSNAVRAEYIRGLDSCFHFDMGDKYIINQLKFEDGANNSYAVMMESALAAYAEKNPDYTDAPFLNNHDTSRAAGLLQGKIEKCKAAAAMYLLAEGIPFIYYGEEIGMKSGTKDETKRTPMLWNGSDAGKPLDKMQTTWASEDDCRYNQKTVSVKEQENDKDSLLTFYKRLIRLRTSHPAFYEGKFHALSVDDSAVSSWEMNSADENIFVMVNLSSKECNVSVPEKYSEGTTVFVSDGNAGSKEKTVSLPPFGVRAIRK